MTRRLRAALADRVADSGPVLVLAAIAAAGSFTHIRDTATEHGQRGWVAWAVAVCIDLTCVMAARERQRDQRTGRRAGRLSWPTLVLVGGVVLSLAANLTQADPTVWGWVTAGTPAGAFLVAVSMLERRSAGHPSRPVEHATATVPSSSGDPSPSPSPSSPWVRWETEHPTAPSATPAVPDDDPPDETNEQDEEENGQTVIPVPASAAAAVAEESAVPSPSPAAPSGSSSAVSSAAPSESSAVAPLVAYARRVAAEHHTKHGRPITRDALRARLGVSNQLASDLLRQVRTEPVSA